MNNWIFFPPAKEQSFPGRDFLILLGLDDGPTKKEWNEFLPETRSKIQRPSLAFGCGNNGKLPDLYHGLPEYTIRKLNDAYFIQPLAWQSNTTYTVSGLQISEYRIVSQKFSSITVPGMLFNDRTISVWGGPLTQFSPFKVNKSFCFGS